MIVRGFIRRISLSASRRNTMHRRTSSSLSQSFAFSDNRLGSSVQHGISMLVTDFDETCTVKDTISPLMNLAAQIRLETLGHTDIGLPAALTENYITKLNILLSVLLPDQEGARDRGISGGIDLPGLHAFLSRLSEFDEGMNRVASEKGAISGLSLQQIHSAARSGVDLRRGCVETLSAVRAAGLPLHIMSVNWCNEHVAEAIGPIRGERFRLVSPEELLNTTDPTPSSTNSSMMLLANRLALGPDGRSTGEIIPLLQSASDKGRAFEWILRHHRLINNGNGSSSAGAVVYVGDSASDLLPLLEADIGIVIGSNKLLRRVAARFGIKLTPLRSHLASLDPADVLPHSRWTREAGLLYTVDDWDDIAHLIFGQSASTMTATQPTGTFRWSQLPVKRSEAEGSPRVPKVLAIAGSDSGGGAGIQADLKAIMACGAFGSCAVTSLTAQNTHGVHGVHPAPIEFLEQQIDVVMSDIGADVIKTGMLPTAVAVKAVAAKVVQCGRPLLVVDPVMVSTSGHSLADGTVASALISHLMPLATVVTPNLPEASALLGGATIESLTDMEEAARKLQGLTKCGAVLVKGGHLAPSPGKDENDAVVDVLFDGVDMHRLSLTRVETNNTHGTGCTLASAIASGLAKGLPLLEAVTQAKYYVQQALASSASLAIGSGSQRPFNHGFMIADWASDRHASDPSVSLMDASNGSQPAARYTALSGSDRSLDRGFVRQAMRLYAVTDPDCNARVGRTMEEAVKQAVAGGATIVQIREKHAGGGGFLATARAAYEVCRSAGVPLVINDRVDIALALGPDVGVHVGQDDLPARDVRRLIGPSRILGVSVKTPEQAARAIRDGADYVGCGACFATGTKDTNVIGLDGLERVCVASEGLPVVAIGGLSASNASGAISAGADGAAVVSAVFSAPDGEAAAREIRDVVEAALAERKLAVTENTQAMHA